MNQLTRRAIERLTAERDSLVDQVAELASLGSELREQRGAGELREAGLLSRVAELEAELSEARAELEDLREAHERLQSDAMPFLED